MRRPTLPLKTFERKALATYGSSLTLTRPTTCKGGICSVTLHVAGTHRSVTYGRTRALGSFLTIWQSG